MEERLRIDPAESRRYLGCGSGADPVTEERISRCSGKLRESLRPRTVWREFALCREEGAIRLDGTVLRLEGEDIARHLAGCSRCVLMAATLGREADQMILRAQPLDMAEAMVLDACATTAVEEVCDRLEESLRQRYGRLTGRFSPGYGDLPLSIQGAVLGVLDAGRRIGLTLSAGGILLPHKSVTAIMGIDPPAQEIMKKPSSPCAGCSRRADCTFRKGGGSCGAA